MKQNTIRPSTFYWGMLLQLSMLILIIYFQTKEGLYFVFSVIFFLIGEFIIYNNKFRKSLDDE